MFNVESKEKKMKYLCSEHYFVEEFSFRSEDNDNDGNVNDNDYFGSGAVVVGTRWGFEWEWWFWFRCMLLLESLALELTDVPHMFVVAVLIVLDNPFNCSGINRNDL